MATDMELAERANAGVHSHVADKVNEILRDKNSKILDIGCGTGALLARLAASGYKHLSGIDIAIPENPVDGVTFVEHDLDTIATPYPDATFELVISVEVFEHVENMGTLLKEISRLLADNGNLLVTTPNVHSLEARLRYFLLGKLKQFDELSDPTHIYPIVLYAFKRLLKRHSLEIVETWGFPLDGSSPTSRGVLRLATKLLQFAGLTAFPPGDHLCLLIQRARDLQPANSKSKRALVASHYLHSTKAAN